MTMTDPIADMLTRIRNANTAKHDTVDVPASKMKIAIANILLDEGYIAKYDLVEDGVFKTIHITLKYGETKNDKIITGLKRISKPGLRILNALTDYRHKRKYAAENGQEGGKKRCHGADGKDIVLKVPEGTVIKEATSGKVIADMSGENQRQIVLKGGRGGKGNI